MVLARHWRIYNEAAQSGLNIALAEIQWRSVAGGADLTAPGGAATASSVYQNSATYDAAKAFDDVATTFWHTGQDLAVGSWIAYDFGADVEPVEVSIQVRHDIANQGVKDGQIQYSADGITWNELKYFRGLTWTNGSTNIVSIPLAVGTPNARIVAAAAEVLTAGDARPRVAALAAEVLLLGTPKARAAAMAAEVLRSVADAPPPASGSRRKQITF